MKTIARIVVFLCTTANLMGQSLTAISGTVSDPTGAAVPRATLVLENTDTGTRRTTASDAEGRYAFPQVPPGRYKLIGQAQGFADVTVEDVRLFINTPALVNIRFKSVGAIAQSVSVQAEVAPVSTTDASQGNAFGSRAILQLPFEARNPVGLLALQPGVTYVGTSLSDRRMGSVNGGKGDQANVVLDGIDVNSQSDRAAFTSVLRVTLDSVEEFRVTTSNANAEQGRSSGAQIALVTKGGTNELHGSFYEYHRNTITTANSFFNNSAGVSRPKLLRNVFGASVGGPAQKNRLFYFVNYEGRRDASDGSAVRVVPSLEMRQGTLRYAREDGSIGVLSSQDLTGLDPLGIGPSPAVMQVLQSYPAPNDTSVGDGLNMLGSGAEICKMTAALASLSTRDNLLLRCT
jgi:hypothetical protein